MKPIIQGALDALAGRISALEGGARSLANTVTTVISNVAALSTLLTSTSGSLTTLTSLVGTGRLWANRQVLTGAGTYTPFSGTKRVLVRMIGGGGGGGGAAFSAGHPDASGAGGNSGWYLEFRVSGSSGANVAGGAFSCGAAGAAGSSAPTNGGTGGDTTIVINGTTFTAKGGTGGGSAIDFNGAPSAPATGSTSVGIDFSCYSPGSPGFTGGSTTEFENIGQQYCGFGGGVAPFGSGGFSVSAGPAVGGTGLGFGGGGAGGCIDFFSIQGAVGSAGGIVIDEFV
jgi:hypothetical protein